MVFGFFAMLRFGSDTSGKSKTFLDVISSGIQTGPAVALADYYTYSVINSGGGGACS